MAEEFHTGICGENWWNLSRNMFISGSSGSGSHADLSWLVPDHMARSCKDSSNLMMNNFSDNLFQDSLKQSDSNSDHSNNSVLMDNNLQMMGFGNISSSSASPSSSSDWNCQTLLQENMSNNSNSNTKEWSTNQEFSRSFSMGLSSSTTTTSYDYPSTIIQSLFESDPQPQQISYSSASNYGNLLNELSPSWSKLISNSLKPSSTTKQQQQLSGTGMQFSNNTPFWNASGATSLHDIRPNFLQNNNNSQFLLPSFDQKPNCPTIPSKCINEKIRDSGSVVKKGSEPVTKRPRIETPSPLPTFKVRKEKLGDRITALQQLVSPFGKTDTASVLHEAIEYIKFLHDQVSVLSSPYMKKANGNGIQHQQGEKLKETEGVKQDLKSRGLCLVPISSTFPVANETTADFWTPTFGGTFR